MTRALSALAASALVACTSVDTVLTRTPPEGGPPAASSACADAGACVQGVWANVTPAGVDLTDGGCGDYGTQTVQVDPAHANTLYAQFDCQGVWKSTDFGQTWSGPVNTGENGATVGDCAGGLTLARSASTGDPVLYLSCIRGQGLGFWSSVNAGVDWTSYTVQHTVSPPAVDPYDSNHLLAAGDSAAVLFQSTDAGHNWAMVTMDPGMTTSDGTAVIAFVNTGDATATRSTWLWIGPATGGLVGTWRTEDGGTSWTHVENNERQLGFAPTYQPAGGAVVYMAGVYSTQGDGVLRSADYGRTWTHVAVGPATVVAGTAQRIYAIGQGQYVDFEATLQPGTGAWMTLGTPATMTLGAWQAAVTTDGTASILVTANNRAGLWRYVEPP
jgi:hypothetical protein